MGFLNDDVIARAPGWCERMVTELARADVGVAGFVLRYPTGELQHAVTRLCRLDAELRESERFAAVGRASRISQAGLTGSDSATARSSASGSASSWGPPLCSVRRAGT